MTNKYLAFLYNVGHDYPDPNDPKPFLEADFDDPGTIEYFLKHLKSCGYNVLPIEANLESYEILRKNKNEIFLAFNYSEVMVEPFLEGREFSIPLLGNKPEIMPIIEPNFNNLPEGYNHIDSFEVKWIYEEDKAGSDHLMCPAKIDMNLKNKLDEIALKVWKALKAKDYCRMDIRCDRDENPYVLEVNSPAGLIPPEVSMTSYLPLSARVMGLSFKELLQKIINSALERNAILV